MNIYHVWCNLKETRRDLEFVENLRAYMEYLMKSGEMAAWRVTRRKLGFGPAELGEFHITMEFKTLAELERAFGDVATRVGEVEELHRKVFAMTTDFKSGLTRDFPDPERVLK
ncbi:MAG: hypothetical protein KDB65_07730 [Calditrichaeota bacterium]|nr:hypothetical protein [Calditrichota bacterium]MCB9369360.1 hypothetical protein [Calditrichota bacterium]